MQRDRPIFAMVCAGCGALGKETRENRIGVFWGGGAIAEVGEDGLPAMTIVKLCGPCRKSLEIAGVVELPRMGRVVRLVVEEVDSRWRVRGDGMLRCKGYVEDAARGE